MIVVEVLLYTHDEALVYARDETRTDVMRVTRFLMNKLENRCIILVHSHVDTINTRTTRELIEKFYRVHACLVHASVKFKLSCTVFWRGSRDPKDPPGFAPVLIACDNLLEYLKI